MDVWPIWFFFEYLRENFLNGNEKNDYTTLSHKDIGGLRSFEKGNQREVRNGYALIKDW